MLRIDQDCLHPLSSPILPRPYLPWQALDSASSPRWLAHRRPEPQLSAGVPIRAAAVDKNLTRGGHLALYATATHSNYPIPLSSITLQNHSSSIVSLVTKFSAN
jgi:hypothetical protein